MKTTKVIQKSKLKLIQKKSKELKLQNKKLDKKYEKMMKL